MPILPLLILNMTHIIKNEEQASKSGWTPYDNKKVKGFPIMTIIRGNKVMHDGELLLHHIGKQIEFEID